ncbi:MAG: HAD family phosphatase [Bryobacteraceae bacterium]
MTHPFALAPGLAFIFDMDGVVVDSMPVHEIAWTKYLESLGIDPGDVAARMHGRRNDEIVMDFLGKTADLSEVEEHGAAKERLYRKMMQEILTDQLVPGVVTFLTRAQSVPMAVASNAERPNIDFVLDGAGLRRFFRVIVDGSEVARPKPAPDIYLRAAQDLGLAPENCIVFEDSPVGITAAREAGARVVGIQTHSEELTDVQIQVKDFQDERLHTWIAQQRPVEIPGGTHA